MSKKKEKQEVYLDNQYQNTGLALGMCFGISIGLAVGNLLYKNGPLGMSSGIGIGMALGIALGHSKDKKIFAASKVITDIIEEDFGCEGVPEDGEVMVKLQLRAEDGTEELYPIPDRLALEKDLQVGDRIYINEQGEIQKYKRSDSHEKQ